MNNKNILTLMAASMAFAACQNEEMPQAASETQAQFATNLSPRVQSRMVDDQWQANDAIGIFTLNDEQAGVILPGGEAAPSNLRLNMQYHTTSGTTWTSDAPFYFKNPTAPTVKFAAYYPWTEDGKINGMGVSGEKITGTIEVNATPQSAEAQPKFDYLYAALDAPADQDPQTPQGSKDQPNVKFQFAHSMTKVVIRLQADPVGSITLEDVKALAPQLKNFVSTGTFNLADGKVTADPFEASTASQGILLSKKAVGSDFVQFTAILPPQLLQNDGVNAPEITLASETGDNFRSAKILKGKDLQAGQCHTVTLTVKKMSLVVESSDITDWTPSGDDSSDAVLQ